MSADILHFVPMTEAPNRIRELRMQAGFSQQALGDAVGVSKMTISDLERGNMRLDTDYLRRIARALEVAPADILSHSDNPSGLSLEERRLIERLRAATPAQRQQFQQMTDVIVPDPRTGAEETAPTRKRA